MWISSLDNINEDGEKKESLKFFTFFLKREKPYSTCLNPAPDAHETNLLIIQPTKDRKNLIVEYDTHRDAWKCFLLCIGLGWERPLQEKGREKQSQALLFHIPVFIFELSRIIQCYQYFVNLCDC